jgi:hypothetical protein
MESAIKSRENSVMNSAGEGEEKASARMEIMGGETNEAL